MYVRLSRPDGPEARHIERSVREYEMSWDASVTWHPCRVRERDPLCVTIEPWPHPPDMPTGGLVLVRVKKEGER